MQLLKLAYVDTSLERFFATHVHSDNAGSHFKSSKTMYFLSTMLVLCATWPAGPAGSVPAAAVAGVAAMSFRAFWEFGPPGHGKGVWDGLGALVKRAVRQDIIDDVALTKSGHIRTAEEVSPGPNPLLILTLNLVLALTLSLVQVAEHVRARFCTDEWRDTHVGKTVNEIIVTYASTEEVHGSRPHPDHE